MAKTKRGLGRGLEALLGGAGTQPPKTAMLEIPVELIRPGKYQPRKNFPEEGLNELAESIRQQGLMQPIVVREVGESYEIIAGERRWRAAQRAEQAKIPAIVRQADDESVLALSLIENLQREDLNPMEEARALQRLAEEFALTHEEIAVAVGKSRVAVTNYLRLNNLSPRVAEMLVDGRIEMGHGRALLPLADADQEKLARDIVRRQLSVRETEAAVRRLGRTPTNKRKSADTRQLEENLSSRIGQPVSIQHTAKGKGKVIISYNDLDELDGILAHFSDEE